MVCWDTHIIPVELQQFHTTTEPTAPLFNAREHELAGDGLVQGPEYAPFGRGVDGVPDFGGQPAAEVSVDQLGVALPVGGLVFK